MQTWFSWSSKIYFQKQFIALMKFDLLAACTPRLYGAKADGNLERLCPCFPLSG